MLFGFLITVIACAKGLRRQGRRRRASGAPSTSPSSPACCRVFFVNIVYTQLLLGLYPDLSVFR